jgi:hypothetical protein
MSLSGSAYEGNGDSTSVQSGGETGSSYLSMTSGDSLFSGSYAPFSKGTYQCGGKKKRKRKTNRKLKKNQKRNTKKRRTNKRRTSKKGKKRQRGGGCPLNQQGPV